MSNPYVESLLTEIDNLKYDLHEEVLKVKELRKQLAAVQQELADLQMDIRMEEQHGN